MEMESTLLCVPPGFRFHPTEEELVGYYLKRKVQSLQIDLDIIVDLDLYKMEPWDIQGRCKLGYEEQNEWFFFSHKDRKYPTGTRTNRATSAGFWKATGRDKAVLSKDRIIGMRKTLVFYKGRAPNGHKSDWIMHEYRLQSPQYTSPQEEGWVVCKAFKKPNPIQKQGFDTWNNGPYLRINDTNNNVISCRPQLPLADRNTFNPILQPIINSQQQLHFGDNPAQLLSRNNYYFQLEPPKNKIDSPSTSKSFVTNNEEDRDDYENGNYGFIQHCNDDWKDMENLLEFELDKPAANLLPHSSTMPLILSENNEQLDSCYQNSHLFGCFSDDEL